MEYIAGALALVLFLWVCSEGSKGSQERYALNETSDERYLEVIDNRTGTVAFVGTKEDCEQWIRRQEQ